MANTIQVDIVSAEKEIWSGEATAVYAVAETGEVGILPKHAPMLARLSPGEVRVALDNNDEELDFYVSSGILEVQPNRVTVLSDTVVRAEDLDEAKAKESLKHAQEQLSNQNSKIDFTRARAELAEATARLRTIQKLRNHKR